jgi:glyoxylase-like metal-dependent hydrolase (beta-lactamase superfamily II)
MEALSYIVRDANGGVTLFGTSVNNVMADPSVDALYEEVRKLVPVTAGNHVPTVSQIFDEIQAVALLTPTLPPAAHTNTYLVGPRNRPMFVVDPGSPYTDQQEAFHAILAGPPELILLTHHHGDHVGGVRALVERWGVPVAAHPLTKQRLSGVVPVDRELADGEVLGSVRCIHTPGHAEGHLCFETDDAIIAGDMVAGIGWILIDPSEGDMAHYLASLGKLLARPPKTLLPAHGPPIVDGHAKLREYIAHRTMREDRVVRALAGREHASPSELVTEVYADTPRTLWPLAERSLRAHVDKLVRDGRVREMSPGRWTLRG